MSEPPLPDPTTCTLSDGLSTIDISGAFWVNEMDEEAVAQEAEESISGALIVETLALQYTKIKLELMEELGKGWLSRADWLAIKTWTKTPGKTLTLFIYGDSFNVIFDRPSMSAKPLWGMSGRTDDEFWTGTLNFIVLE